MRCTLDGLKQLTAERVARRSVHWRSASAVRPARSTLAEPLLAGSPSLERVLAVERRSGHGRSAAWPYAWRMPQAASSARLIVEVGDRFIVLPQ
jgi:hypothetical protein